MFTFWAASLRPQAPLMLGDRQCRPWLPRLTPLTSNAPKRPSRRSNSFLLSLRSVNISLMGGFPLCIRNSKIPRDAAANIPYMPGRQMNGLFFSNDQLTIQVCMYKKKKKTNANTENVEISSQMLWAEGFKVHYFLEREQRKLWSMSLCLDDGMWPPRRNQKKLQWKCQWASRHLGAEANEKCAGPRSISALMFLVGECLLVSPLWEHEFQLLGAGSVFLATPVLND